MCGNKVTVLRVLKILLYWLIFLEGLRILKSYYIHSYGLFILKVYRLEIRKEQMYKRSEFRRDIDFNCSLNGVIAEFSQQLYDNECKLLPTCEVPWSLQVNMELIMWAYNVQKTVLIFSIFSHFRGQIDLVCHRTANKQKTGVYCNSHFKIICVTWSKPLIIQRHSYQV